METDPFPGLKVSDSSVLERLEGRTECPKCHKSRKYFCYTCYLPVAGLENKLPKVKLPLKIDIIKHPKECDGKSTSSHAALLAPDDVTIFSFPCIPDYDPREAVLVFPCNEALSLEDYLEQRHKTRAPNCSPSLPEDSTAETGEASHTSGTEAPADIPSTATDTSLGINGEVGEEGQGGQKCRLEDCQGRDLDEEGASGGQAKIPRVVPKTGIARVIFIDSTWKQTKMIFNDERLKGLQKVELRSRTTKFWRWQQGLPNTCLSTIEAIYHFLCDYHALCSPQPYNGHYDDLLFFFCFTYHKIRRACDGGVKIKAYNRDDYEDRKSKKKRL